MSKNGNYFLHVAQKISSNLYVENKRLKLTQCWGKWRRDPTKRHTHAHTHTHGMFSVQTKLQQSVVNCYTASYVPFVDVYIQSILFLNEYIPFNCCMQKLHFISLKKIKTCCGVWLIVGTTEMK